MAERKCDICGAGLPGQLLGGLCPDCLLHYLIPGDDGSEASGSAGEPPVGPDGPQPPGAMSGVAEGRPGTEAPGEPASEKPGDRIGRYKLLERIGEGGMGIVWVAEQTEPVRRTVALKVIKPGMDSAQVLARFEAERQALALMDHPNIAKILDAGATPQGRPYFVMELIKGVSLTLFCDEQRLSVRERLELFIPVCQAIQHAHQKGIIHRDLKPSNVLVALYSGKPVPKVIDFGVAKALGQPLTERTQFTHLGMFVGTLRYMAPEQAEANQLDIDTRSDIYSLGVLLYELLTGTTPLTPEGVHQAALAEVFRRIREEDPPKPSLRLSTSQERLPTISAQRKLEPEKLKKLVQGDLDWIVMKALDKERSRRYETPNALGLDLRRHLDNEPVVARPPSAAYRVQKFVRRNRIALGFASTLVFLAAALLGSAVLLFKEWTARRYTGITIKSKPAGAEVWHDGQMLGYTPLQMAGLPPGEFTYILVSANFEPVINTTALVPKKHMNDFTFLLPVGSRGIGAAVGPSTNVTEFVAMEPQEARIVELQGTVEIACEGARFGIAMATPPALALRAGDRLLTRANSRVALDLSGSIFRFGELTQIEILASTNRLDNPSLRLKVITRGAVAGFEG